MDGIHIIHMMIKHMDTKIKLFLEYALCDKQSQKPDEDIPDAETGTWRNQRLPLNLQHPNPKMRRFDYV